MTLQKRMYRSEASGPFVWCDESGLCEEINQIAVEREPNGRCVYVGPHWALLVDISPIAVGHCLVTQFEHLPRSTLLGRSLYLERAKEVDHMRRSLEAAGSDVVIVEHGSSDRGGLGDCVRHAHVHLCPIPTRSSSVAVLERSFSRAVDRVRVTSTWEEAYEVAARLEAYVMLAWRGYVLVGIPRPVFQITRAILGHFWDIRGDEIDWAINPWNEKFEPTGQLLKSIEWAHE